jgi:hypothetical protein
MQVETLHTIGTIAAQRGVPIHRIEYVIRSRKIRAIGMAGHARVFSDAAVERIASELRRIDADREGAA